jgi:thiosulfate/3-mercaptopyruvate sulfurtransferase
MTNALVSTAWVAERLGRQGLRLIDVPTAKGGYARAHLPGAVAIDWQRELIEAEDESSGKVIDPERFAALARRLGLREDDTLVFYGDEGGRHALRALWTFEYYAHRGALHFMDGGRERWLAEGRPVSDEATRVEPSSYAVPSRRNPSVRATLDDVRAGLQNDRFTVLDVRTAEEYAGADVRAARGGHIPGALHIYWEDALQPNGSLKPKDQLERLYAAVPKEGTVAVHCQLGVRAAHTWFILRHVLGHPDVRNYDGSWQEWGNRHDTPVE